MTKLGWPEIAALTLVLFAAGSESPLWVIVPLVVMAATTCFYRPVARGIRRSRLERA